jgi:hypothetical protein
MSLSTSSLLAWVAQPSSEMPIRPTIKSANARMGWYRTRRKSCHLDAGSRFGNPRNRSLPMSLRTIADWCRIARWLPVRVCR